MKAIEFRGMTAKFAEDQDEYQTLPAHVDSKGVVTSAWKLSDEEILKILETGTVWISQMTCGLPLQPILPSTERPEGV